MVLTQSNPFPIGSRAPKFRLLDTVSGDFRSLDEMKSDKTTVIMFICNHCPYVKLINARLIEIAKKYQKKGVSFMGISSNDVSKYPEDSPERMKEMAMELGYPFPYLYDDLQSVARAYDAACTPEFYVFDADMELAYHGQMDGARPGNGIEVTGEDLCQALDLLLGGKSVPPDQKPGIGCGIKWKT